MSKKDEARAAVEKAVTMGKNNKPGARKAMQEALDAAVEAGMDREGAEQLKRLLGGEDR